MTPNGKRGGKKIVKLQNKLCFLFKYLDDFVLPAGFKGLSLRERGGCRVERFCWVNFQYWGVLLLWINVWQGPTALANRCWLGLFGHLYVSYVWIDALAEEEQELEALVESLDKTCTRYKMEISAEKTKLMTNSANGIQREIKVKGQVLCTVTSFKYLGAVVSDDGSKPEVLSKIAQATAALTKLKPIWRDNNISLGSKVKLMRSLVISIFLYACESWTLTAELEKRTQAFEMRCYRRLLNISYEDHVTNDEVRRKIQAAIGEYDELLTLVKK